MKKAIDILASAQKTIQTEAAAITGLLSQLNSDFEKSVKLILKAKGRLVITGVGKSAIIAQKLVATFNSTGQPAVFMHAADAIHGDLGNVQKGDIVLCISKSGDSPEIKVLVPLVKALGSVLIGMAGNEKGFLAKHADLVLMTVVDKEACPNNLAPTSSTTAQLVMGDALAVALMEQRGFSSKDFARYHPGGALGKKLYVRMGDLVSKEEKREVDENLPVKDVIVAISKGRAGAVAVLKKKKIIGIITDGDIRRMLERNSDFAKMTAIDVMSKNPKVIDSNELAVSGFQVMEAQSITQLIVIKNEQYMGIVHLHDILKEGIF